MTDSGTGMSRAYQRFFTISRAARSLLTVSASIVEGREARAYERARTAGLRTRSTYTMACTREGRAATSATDSAFSGISMASSTVA